MMDNFWYFLMGLEKIFNKGLVILLNINWSLVDFKVGFCCSVFFFIFFKVFFLVELKLIVFFLNVLFMVLFLLILKVILGLLFFIVLVLFIDELILLIVFMLFGIFKVF